MQTRFFQNIRIALFFSATGTTLIPSSFADLPDRLHPKLNGHPQTISNGIKVRITPQGENFFKQHLDMILQSMSFYPDQGFFPKIDRPLDIAGSPEDQKRVQTVKDTLQTFIKGLKVKHPAPRLSFDNLGYNARITKLSAIVDRAMTNAKNLNNGVVVMVDLEADQISVELDKMSVSDDANDWAGSAGLTRLQLSQTQKSVPLQARAWVQITTDPETYVSDFKVLKIESSVSAMNLEYQVEGVEVPVLAVHINGQRYPINRSYLNSQLTQKKIEILEGLRCWLDDLVSKTLPETLSEIMNEHLKGEFGNTMYFKPPGAPKDKSVREFIMTFINTKINLQQGIEIELASRVWDPLNADSPLNRKWTAKPSDSPSMRRIPDDKHDLAISINKGLVNQLVKLSFERGYFKKVPLKTGGMASLTVSPVIETVPLENGKVDPKRFRIWIQGKFLATGMQSILLKKWYDVGFEVTGHLAPNPKGAGLLFACEKVNTRTMRFPDSNYKNEVGKFLHPGILPLVKNFVEDLNQEWAKAPLMFDQVIPLPPSFFGLEMKLNEYELDPAGFLTMYLTLPSGDVKW